MASIPQIVRGRTVEQKKMSRTGIIVTILAFLALAFAGYLTIR